MFMNKEKSKLSWNRKNNNDLNEIKEFWDSRAEEFYKISQDDELGLIDYLQEKDFIDKSYSVLDIGCGTGKYILKMAEKVKYVQGLDISPEMIKYAKKNIKAADLKNTGLKVLSWQEIDVRKEALENKFDLVFASMTPALNSEESLVKMVRASRKFCFMSGFAYRNDYIKDRLFNDITGTGSVIRKYDIISDSFNTLWNMGMYPEIVYKDVEWTKEFSVQKAVDMYTIEICRYADDTQKARKNIKDYMEKISSNGIVKDYIKAKIAWMTWKIC